MSYFKISRVQRIGATLSASVWLPITVSAGPNSGQFNNPWGVMISTGSVTGTIFFDSGSIPANELPLNVPVPGSIRRVTCTAEHIFILG